MVPLSATMGKIMIMFYPLPPEELLEEHPLAQHPQFPGLKVLSLECPLGIPSGDLVDRQWGSPILPAILVASPLGGVIPDTVEIRSAMAAILRRVHLPEVKLNRTYLMEKMEALRRDGESQLVIGQPEAIWPEMGHQSIQAATGRSHL